ncbi:MAG: hypothetical protein EOO40_07675 [Deltaproteobacteria bacterium]|nr:MAG: hypothetical protein EOO40_07675 [Deltaproteobacteria bacterium]
MSESDGEVHDTDAGLYGEILSTACNQTLQRQLHTVASAEQSRAADRMHFEGLLDQLAETVTAGYVEKVRTAAAEGQRSAELFDFDGGDKMEGTDHSLLFLTKGPRRQGQDFFLRLGLLPFMTRVWLIVRPFEPEMTYDPEANENVVSVRW